MGRNSVKRQYKRQSKRKQNRGKKTKSRMSARQSGGVGGGSGCRPDSHIWETKIITKEDGTRMRLTYCKGCGTSQETPLY
jgi:Pyruvate/2-oxoacid:ferredoxin oxidoreductase delta subunit